jgi:hypothetical protein
MTFASFDWMMSLVPGWSSTVYSIYWFAGGVTASLGLLAALSWWSHRRSGTEHDRASPALANLTLTFVLFWLYAGFSQYIVMWSANLPSEVGWYVARTAGGWGVTAWALIVLGGAIPFLALLTGRIKRGGPMLALVGATILAMHVVDTYWLLVPGIAVMTGPTILLGLVLLPLILAPTVAIARLRP